MNDLIGDKIKHLVEKSSYSNIDFAKKLNMSEQNLYRIFKKRSIDTKLLVDISNLLGVPVSYFFEEGVTGGSGVEKNLNHSQFNYQQGDGNKNAQHVGDGCVECGRLRREVESLQELLKAKDEIINLLKERK